MPVLCQHDMTEARRQTIDDRNDFVALGHRQRAARTKIVLHIDDDQNFVAADGRAFVHGFANLSFHRLQTTIKLGRKRFEFIGDLDRISHGWIERTQGLRQSLQLALGMATGCRQATAPAATVCRFA